MSKISIEGNASGTGTLTIAAPNTNTNYTLTLPTETGTLVTTGITSGLDASALTTGTVNSDRLPTVPVSKGGTGATTLTSNNVILGNGTSAVQFVAPGTNGNILTSNGTTWTSAAAPSSGMQVDTNTASSTTNYNVGTYISAVDGTTNRPLCGTVTVYRNNTSSSQTGFDTNSGTSLSGTWRNRGRAGRFQDGGAFPTEHAIIGTDGGAVYQASYLMLLQRTA